MRTRDGVLVQDLLHVIFLISAVIAHVAEPASSRRRSVERIVDVQVADLSIQLFPKDAVAVAAAEILCQVMTNLRVQIMRFVGEQPQPGIAVCLPSSRRPNAYNHR